MVRFLAGLLVGGIGVGVLCYAYCRHVDQEQYEVILQSLQPLTQHAARAEQAFDRMYRGLQYTRKFGCNEHVLEGMERAAETYKTERKKLHELLHEGMSELEKSTVKGKLSRYAHDTLDMAEQGIDAVRERVP
ncbi:hypothetical protein HYS48_05275 [Candidatus Woesearchaeota archaeon]|nr:hypothetical protein [Candidatus Woesearchaeota archaeon]